MTRRLVAVRFFEKNTGFQKCHVRFRSSAKNEKRAFIIPVVYYIDRRCTRGARLVHFKISTDPRPRRTLRP